MTSTVLKDFKDRVEAFLSRTGMSPATFGRFAINDGSFVADMRAGSREFRLSTMETVDEFMAEYVAAYSAHVMSDEDESSAPSPSGSAGPVMEGKAA